MPKQQAPQKEQKERNFIHSFFLIAIETLLTFLLKHDRLSRIQAQHLIQKKAVVCIKTHLPSDTFYVTFAPQGVLFDFELAHGAKIDATVKASSIDILRAFLTARTSSFEKIGISGDSQYVNELRQLMQYFNIPQIVSDWRHWFSFVSRDVTPVSQQMKPLLRRIDEQRLQISNLVLNTKQQAYEIRQIRKKYHIWISLLALTISLLIAGLIGMWWYFN